MAKWSCTHNLTNTVTARLPAWAEEEGLCEIIQHEPQQTNRSWQISQFFIQTQWKICEAKMSRIFTFSYNYDLEQRLQSFKLVQKWGVTGIYYHTKIEKKSVDRFACTVPSFCNAWQMDNSWQNTTDKVMGQGVSRTVIKKKKKKRKVDIFLVKCSDCNNNNNNNNKEQKEESLENQLQLLSVWWW